jgi:hypothetical protein
MTQNETPKGMTPAYFCPRQECKYHQQMHFTKLCKIREHYLRLHTSGEKACPHPNCDKKYATDRDLKHHLKSCQRAALVCKCGVSLGSLAALKRHIKRFAVGTSIAAHGVTTHSMAAYQTPRLDLAEDVQMHAEVAGDVSDGGPAAQAIAHMHVLQAHHDRALRAQMQQPHAQQLPTVLARSASFSMVPLGGIGTVIVGEQTRCKKCQRPKAPSNYGFCTLHRDPLSSRSTRAPLPQQIPNAPEPATSAWSTVGHHSNAAPFGDEASFAINADAGALPAGSQTQHEQAGRAAHPTLQQQLQLLAEV